MKTIANLMKRAGLWVSIYLMEIQIEGMTKAISLVSCPTTLDQMDISLAGARTELARLRSEYIATFPAGHRRTWGMA